MTAKIHLIGNIGKKEVKTVKEDMLLVVLSIATNESTKNAQGEKVEITSWHYVNFFGKLAEIVEKYTEVGNVIYVEGDVSNRKVKIKDADRWVYSIRATQVKLLPNARKEAVKSSSQSTELDDLLDDIGF